MSTDRKDSDQNMERDRVSQNENELIFEDKFYVDGRHYWAEIPATVDGMLGGFGYISEIDIKGSKLFLKKVFALKTPPARCHALDCGAGIGRISKHLLTKFFNTVDLVEQNDAFLQTAKEYLGVRLQSKIGNYYAKSLQEFIPDESKYDVIWVQWVLGHLKDDDLITFFNSCKSGLKENGVIVVKENITSADQLELDRNDSSVTRPYKALIEIFDRANLDVIIKSRQHNFPKSWYSVYMFTLRPRSYPTSSNISEIETVL